MRRETLEFPPPPGYEGRAGWVAEWFKALVLKTSVGGTPPWVRIPPLPPLIIEIAVFSMCLLAYPPKYPPKKMRLAATQRVMTTQPVRFLLILTRN